MLESIQNSLVEALNVEAVFVEAIKQLFSQCWLLSIKDSWLLIMGRLFGSRLVSRFQGLTKLHPLHDIALLEPGKESKKSSSLIFIAPDV